MSPLEAVPPWLEFEPGDRESATKETPFEGKVAFILPQQRVPPRNVAARGSDPGPGPLVPVSAYAAGNRGYRRRSSTRLAEHAHLVAVDLPGYGHSEDALGKRATNPAAVATPIRWSAALIDHHVVALNAIFALIQLLLGLGIALRPTLKLALAASVAWALAVWWLGEGLGGLLTGTASPVNGAPGAVLIYALLAVLLWPADRDPAPPFIAACAVDRRPAQASWLSVWLGLAALALLPASRTLSGMPQACQHRQRPYGRQDHQHRYGLCAGPVRNRSRRLVPPSPMR